MSVLKTLLLLLLLVESSYACTERVGSCCFVLYLNTGDILCNQPPPLYKFPPAGIEQIRNGEKYKSVQFGRQCSMSWGSADDFKKFLPNLKSFVWDSVCRNTCIPGPPVTGATFSNICIRTTEDTTIATTEQTKAAETTATTRQIETSTKKGRFTEVVIDVHFYFKFLKSYADKKR